MAKDPLQTQAKSVEPEGMDDAFTVASKPADFIQSNGIFNSGKQIERMTGKLLYRRTNVPIVGLHVTKDAMWVQTRTRLILFTYTDVKTAPFP
jgi:hypothetical protein